MDNIKYQVFISSTYSDLVEERKKILDILLIADCIPAGMENFVATDDEQFNVIKRVIDMCDYYILIIGRRYGSVNEKTGISYTEMEYNYAVDKGIPVLVFALDDSVELDASKTESDDIKRGKLAEFRSKAMSNRLASVWKDSSDLMGKVAIAIMKAKTELKRPGWHRGKDEEKIKLINEIEQLKKENHDLIENQGLSFDEKGLTDENFYQKIIELHFTEKVFVFTDTTTIDRRIVSVTIADLFKYVSLRLTGVKTLSSFRDAISSYQEGYYVGEQDALIVRNKLEQLGLIKSDINKDQVEVLKLTDLGIKMMDELNKL